MYDLSDRVVVVTGAASGIGAATVERLIAENAVPVAWDLREPTTPQRGSSWKVDVSDEESVSRAMDEVARQHGRIDGLVNCAGVMGDVRRLGDQDPASVRRTFAVNADSVLLTVRSALPHLIGSGSGSVVNVSSNAALYARTGLAPYSATKAAVIAYTRTAAREYGGVGVRFNAVCPGGTKTPMVGPIETPEVQALIDTVPLKRFAEPREIANAICFLLSDEASFVTGSVLVVDGGMHL